MHEILSMLKTVLRNFFLKDPDTVLPLRVLFFERFGGFYQNPNSYMSFISFSNFKTPTNNWYQSGLFDLCIFMICGQICVIEFCIDV